MTFSMVSVVESGQYNWAFLYINGDHVTESQHTTHHSESGKVVSSGGREVTREVSQGDTIELRAISMDGFSLRIHFCAEYVPKM